MAEWFYRFGGTDQGPVSEADLKHIFDSEALPLTTPVWREGMQDWVEAETVAALRDSTRGNSLDEKRVQQPSLKAKPDEQTRRTDFRIEFIAVVCLLLIAVWVSQTHRGNLKTATFRDDPNQPKQTLDKPELTKDNDDLDKRKQNTFQQFSDVWTDRSNGNLALTKLITTVENAEQSAMRSKGITNENYRMAVASIRSELESSDTDLSNFPNPQIGNPSKVSELCQYLQEKLQNVNQRNPVMLSFNPKNRVWCIHDQRAGYLLDLSDLDPSSAQIVSKPQTTLDGNATGTIYYSVHITTRNSRKRVIAYDSSFLPRVTVQADVNIPCGTGPGERDTRKIGETLAALIVAYGGKNELSN